jgi:hypothetical protein
MTETQLDESGNVVITTKVSAQEYIKNKLMTIQLLQQQMAAIQDSLNKEVDELRLLG